MNNYHILKNLPEEFLDVIMEEWLRAKENLKDNEDFDYVVADKNQDYIYINKSNRLHDLVKSFISVPYQGIIFLINNPKSGLGPVHIDANRECAINIPLEVDFLNSCYFTANQECTERPIRPDEGMANKGTKRYLYEPHKYDYYNSREPALINTKAPHGFFNFGDTPRVLFSISFGIPYDEVLKELTIND